MLFIFFCLGTIVASFANCHAIRYQLGISNYGRSICDHCHTQLKWWKLIPIVGYIIQKGKCNQCKNLISPLYPLIELATGILFIHLCMTLPVSMAIRHSLLFSWIIILALEDFYTKTVNLKLLLIGEFLIGIMYLDFHSSFFIYQLTLSIIITLCLSILSSKNYLGWADTLLLSLFSLILPPLQFSTMVLVASIGALLTFKTFKKITIPFIPWISIGLCFTWIFPN